MLCVLFLVFLISGALTQDSEVDEKDLEDERYNYTCVIPPNDIIRNGRFRVEGYSDDEQPPAGKKTYSYVLQVTCNPGFNLKGWYLVQCSTNKGTDEFPECLPTCKRNSPDVFSCGSGFGNEEARCLAPRNYVDEISNRARTELQCGVTPQKFRTTVVNGREANREEAPWHAGVYTKTTTPYMQICGGTIVSNNVVISAAHCFWSDAEKILPAENYAVAVGKLFRPWNDTNDPDAQKFDVQEIKIPPRFQGSTTNYQDDIALLILAAPFVIKFSDQITPACLDFNFDFDARQLAQGKIGRVSGWGLDSEDGPSSQVLNVVELPVVSIEQCIAGADPGFLPSITSDKICAGFTNGTAVCKGDSGGGLVVPDVVDGTTRYFLRGIISTAPRSDHLCNIYAVATFTHVVKHEHFIMAAINQIPLMNEAPNLSPTPTTFPPIMDDNKKVAETVDTEDKRYVEVITENGADTLLTGGNTNVEEDSKSAADTSLTADETNIEGTTKHSADPIAFEDNTFVENTTQNMLSPLPLTNLNSSHSKEKLNASATISNPDEGFQEMDADLTKIPLTQNRVPEKINLEPITNPPLNDNDSYDEKIKDTDLDTSEKEDIEGMNFDTNKKEDLEDTEEEDIGTDAEQSFETVNSDQNPITDTTKESSADTESVSSAKINDNIAKTPTSGVPIGITIGQTYETVNSEENLDSVPTDEELSDTGAANTNTNNQLEKIPSSDEAIEANVGQVLDTVKPKVPFIDTPIEINIGKGNSNPSPSTVKESAKNDDSITIWPTFGTPGVNKDPVDSNPNPGPENNGAEYTQTTAILEDYWVTAGPDCDHETPGHFHHHWPYHQSWEKHPIGPGLHQNWHKQPSSPSFHHDWHNQPSWQNPHQNWHSWNPTNWQHKRFHPFVEYHHGFHEEPSKLKPNYAGPWFGRFRL